MKVGEVFWNGKPGAVQVADLPGGHSAWGDAEVQFAIPSVFLLSFLAQVAQLCERALRLHKERPKHHRVVAKVKEFGGRLGEMMGISTYQLIGMVGGMVA